MWRKFRRSSFAQDSGNSPPASPTFPSTSPTSRFKSPTWISGALPSSKRLITFAGGSSLSGSQPKPFTTITRDANRSTSETPISLLTSLPTEIILSILTYMDDRSLFALSQLCRVFNELALREALSRPKHGSLSINDLTGHRHDHDKDTGGAQQEGEWEESSDDGDVVHIQAHTIRYLRMALFVRGIRKLDLTFPAVEVMRVRVGDMTRLRDLVERLNESLSTSENNGRTDRGAGGRAAMEELLIDFSEDLLRPSNTTPNFGVVPATRPSRQSRKPLCTAFTSLLSASAGQMDTPAVLIITCLGIFTTKVSLIPNWKLHKGCYDVERFDAVYVTAHNGALRLAPMIPSVIAMRVCNVPNSTSGTKFGGVAALGSTSPQPQPLAPPTYSWTIVTIDPFLINHLDLSLDSLSTSEWSILLHTLDLPNLTEVSIWSKAINQVHSALFLNRHQTITVLHHSSQIPFSFKSSSSSSGSGRESVYCPRVVLPHLERLNAKPQYITYILTAPQPNSNSPTNDSSPNTNPLDHFHSLHTIRIGGLTKETEHTICEALNAISRINRHAHNTGSDGVLNLSFTSIHPSTLDRLLSLEPAPTSILNITTLTLLGWPLAPPPHNHTPSTWFSLPLFIHLFPHLQKLCISGSLPEEVNLRDQMKWRRDLVRGVWEVCPWVELYVVDGMEGSTEWWMHGVRLGTAGS